MPPRTTKNSLAPDPSDLTDNEGSLLALVLRKQPITAYQIMKIHEQSPVTSFNTSKGGLYPAITRLRRRGYMIGTPVEGDGRGAEKLSCTPAGEVAAKQWLKDLRDTHFVPVDPLRTRVLSFELLTRDEQIEWIVDAKAQMAAKLAEIERYDAVAAAPFQDLIRENATSALQSRMQWLDKLMRVVVKGAARD